MEFLVDYTIIVPEGTAADVVENLKVREAERVRELADEGYVVRLWRPPAAPGEWRGLGLWRGRDADDVQTALESLPLYPWFDVEVTALGSHPNDPANRVPPESD
jgi:muconolactone delta-isomerase